MASPTQKKPGTNTGHGHVWKRPDGITARCGGPAVCDECYEDALMWGDGSAEPHGVIHASKASCSSSSSSTSVASKVPPQFVRGNRHDRRAAKARSRRK